MPKLGLGINIQSGVVGFFTAEYLAILNQARTSGYTLPSPSEQLLQNKLIADLKSAGIWAKLDAFYMFANNIFNSSDVYSGSSFALLNWKNPSSNYGAGAPNLPSISALSGFTGSSVGGSNQGINLNFTPSTQGVNFANPNASFGVMLGTASATTGSPIMGANGSINNYNRIRQNGTGSVAGSTISAQSFSNNSFVHVNRKLVTGNAVPAQYVNGSSTVTTFASQTFPSDAYSFNILRYGDLASYGDSQIKAAFIGGDLSAEAVTFYSTINNYITSLNNLYSSSALTWRTNIIANSGTITYDKLYLFDKYFFTPAAANGNILNQLDRLNIYAGLSGFQTAANTNLISSSFTVTTSVTAPTFDANGYKSSGITSYLNLNYNPSTQGVNFTQDSNIAGVVFKNINTTATFTAMGSINTGGNTAHTVEFRSGDSSLRSFNNSDASASPPPMSLTPLPSGILFAATRRTSSTTAEVLANATSASFTLSSNGNVNVSQYELAFNNSGVAASGSDTNNYHICSFHGSSSLDYTNFRTYISNLLTVLGV